MPTTKLKCRCKLGYECSAPLHGEIEIITCENLVVSAKQKNCDLVCDGGLAKRRKRIKKTT